LSEYSACDENKVQLDIGDSVKVDLPWSEVCMHMRIAGRVMTVKILPSRMAQILNDSGEPFSFPVTLGEAGIYDRDGDGFYAYGVKA